MSPSQALSTGGSPLAELVEEYLEHIGSRRRSHTVALRRTVLERVFLPWAEREGIRELDDITPKALDRWSDRLQSEPGPAGHPLSEVTVATYCRELNLFLGWAAKHADGTPGLRAGAPPLLPRTIDVLTREEIAAMEKAAATARDRLIVRVLADTGIRAGELVNLTADDVVREEGRCYIRVRGKRGGRIIGIEASLYRALHKLADDRAGPIFLGLVPRRRGQPPVALTVSGVRQVVQELATQAGITKPVTSHLLRHSFATWYLNQGGDPLSLRRDLGHASLRMIDQVYVHLAGRDRHDKLMELLRGGKRRTG